MCSYLNQGEGLHTALYSMIGIDWPFLHLSGRALSESRIPCGYTQLYSQKEHVHSFYTDPQSSAKSMKKFWPRGVYDAVTLESTGYIIFFFLKQDCLEDVGCFSVCR